MLALLELILWFLPDFVEIGKAASSYQKDKDAAQGRLAIFGRTTLARHRSPSSTIS